jgi:glycosyltransferase involved in cell wall biosynthesis
LKFLANAGFDIHTASIDGPLARRLQELHGYPWTPLPLTREFAPLSDRRARNFIENFCRREKFDIVHTHTPKGNVIGQWAARRAGVPIVLQTLHGFYFHERMPWFKRRAWIAVERFSAKHSDHVLCQNPEDVETAVRERIVAHEKISLLGNGIDLEKFQPADAERKRRVRQSIGIDPDAMVIGMAARFVAEKGFPEFLAAGELLRSRGPRVHLLAVGLHQPSERSGESWTPPQTPLPNTTLLTNRDDMPDLYAAMDLHVLPSHREGFPRALMEGAAAGLAQVCTNIRGCRQTVEDGVTGFFVNVGDIPALAARIQQLLDDAPLRQMMGHAARAKALAEFDQRTVFQKVEQTYRQLLSARKMM